MLGEWLKLTMLASGSFFGVYAVFGLILDQMERLNITYIASTTGKIGIMLTGFIGTVVHEFAHYVLCLVFGHQVVEVAWFRPIQGMRDGVLGYVQHSYNPNNLYEQVGNFFIGIAPLLLGSIFILLLFRTCLPSASKRFTQQMQEQMRRLASDFTLGHIFSLIFKQAGALFRNLFTGENFRKPGFWIFMIAAYSISTHMSLSLADLQGALVGVGVIFIAIVVGCFVLALVHLPVKRCAGALVKYNAFLISIFSVALIFSAMTLLISAGLYYLIP